MDSYDSMRLALFGIYPGYGREYEKKSSESRFYQNLQTTKNHSKEKKETDNTTAYDGEDYIDNYGVFHRLLR